MITWEWVGIPTAPNAFLALVQGTESKMSLKISRETEISIGNVAWGKRSELHEARSNDNR